MVQILSFYRYHNLQGCQEAVNSSLARGNGDWMLEKFHHGIEMNNMISISTTRDVQHIWTTWAAVRVRPRPSVATSCVLRQFRRNQSSASPKSKKSPSLVVVGARVGVGALRRQLPRPPSTKRSIVSQNQLQSCCARWQSSRGTPSSGYG